MLGQPRAPWSALRPSSWSLGLHVALPAPSLPLLLPLSLFLPRPREHAPLCARHPPAAPRACADFPGMPSRHSMARAAAAQADPMLSAMVGSLALLVDPANLLDVPRSVFPEPVLVTDTAVPPGGGRTFRVQRPDQQQVWAPADYVHFPGPPRAAPNRQADPEAGPDGPLPSDAIMAMLDRTNDSRALLGFPRLPMTLMHYLTSCPRLRLADLLGAAATSSDSTAKSIAAAVVAAFQDRGQVPPTLVCWCTACGAGILASPTADQAIRNSDNKALAMIQSCYCGVLLSLNRSGERCGVISQHVCSYTVDYVKTVNCGNYQRSGPRCTIADLQEACQAARLRGLPADVLEALGRLAPPVAEELAAEAKALIETKSQLQTAVSNFMRAGLRACFAVHMAQLPQATHCVSCGAPIRLRSEALSPGRVALDGRHECTCSRMLSSEAPAVTYVTGSAYATDGFLHFHYVFTVMPAEMADVVADPPANPHWSDCSGDSDDNDSGSDSIVHRPAMASRAKAGSSTAVRRRLQVGTIGRRSRGGRGGRGGR
jgi:hypothetical protein